MKFKIKYVIVRKNILEERYEIQDHSNKKLFV